MLISETDARTVGHVLREAAQSEILPRFRQLAHGQVRRKSSAHDLVTDADVAAERTISAALARAFPSAVVVGEEAAAADASILDRLPSADLAFVIDPVDGTKNFASGLPLFGVIAAVLVSGEVAGGVIYDPILDDFAFAVRGEGAWTENAEGVRGDLKVSATTALSDMSGLVSWKALPEPVRSTVATNLAQFAVVNSYRCVAHEYRFLCAGHADFSMYAKLMPWDHAAGWLLHREAGGYSARLDGSPYLPTRTDGGILYAADKGNWDAIHGALFGVH